MLNLLTEYATFISILRLSKDCMIMILISLQLFDNGKPHLQITKVDNKGAALHGFFIFAGRYSVEYFHLDVFLGGETQKLIFLFDAELCLNSGECIPL